MVDHDAVAVAAVHARNDDRAAVRRDDGRAGFCADVNAGVGLGGAVDGVHAQPEAAGEIRARRDRPDERASADDSRGRLRLALLLKRNDHVGHVRLRLALGSLKLLKHGGVIGKIRGDVGDERGRLVKLGLKLRLFCAQLVLLFNDVGLILLILGDDGFRVLARFYIGVLKGAVALHDLADVVHRREKFRKCGGVEEILNIAGVAVLLHGAHARAVFIQLLRFERLGLVDLDALVGDHAVVELYFLLGELYLPLGVHIPLVKRLLDGEHARLLVFQLVDDCLLFLPLADERVALGLELVQLLLRDGACLHRCACAQHGKHESRRKQHRKQPFISNAHIFLPGKGLLYGQQL